METASRDAMSTASIAIVLGGSSFMGLHLASFLKAANEFDCVFVLNRGTRYWSGVTTPNADSPTSSRFVHMPMDREDCASVESAFRSVLQYLSERHADRNCRLAFCDFSCDDDVFMRRVWRSLSALGMVAMVGVYVLISTDSVYEGSSTSDATKTGGVSESCACVPSSRRGYPGEKVRAEESFHAQINHHGLRDTIGWYILRLPDVVGPFDNSGRYWACVLWALSGVPLLLSRQSASERISLVSGVDVARLCLRLLTGCTLNHSDRPASGVYNLSCREIITVKELVSAIATRVGVALPKVFGPLRCEDGALGSSSSSSDSDDDDECQSASADYYPSVTCGPLSIEAAVKALNWMPTPIGDILDSSTDFFRTIPRKGREYKRAFAKLPAIVKASLVSV